MSNSKDDDTYSWISMSEANYYKLRMDGTSMLDKSTYDVYYTPNGQKITNEYNYEYNTETISEYNPKKFPCWGVGPEHVSANGCKACTTWFKKECLEAKKKHEKEMLSRKLDQKKYILEQKKRLLIEKKLISPVDKVREKLRHGLFMKKEEE